MTDRVELLEETDLPARHAARCPGRRPLRVTPSIAARPGWWRIVRVALWIGAVLFGVLLVSQPLRGAQPSGAFQGLPQRTQEVLAIIALQAEVSRVAANSSESKTQDSYPAITRRTSGREVARELSPWLLNNASAELNGVFGMVQASEEAFATWFYHWMDAVAANNYGRSEEQVANVAWIERRIRLESAQSAVAWDRLLWGLISELTADPLERADLNFAATMLAAAQFDQP